MADDDALASPPAAPLTITDDTAQQFIALSTKDLELRARELELGREELAQGTQYAEKALAAQAEDFKDARQHARSSARDRYVFGGIVIVLLLVFAGWAMYLEKEQIVLQVLQILGPLVIGFGSGYVYGRLRAQQPPSAGNEPPPS